MFVMVLEMHAVFLVLWIYTHVIFKELFENTSPEARAAAEIFNFC